MSGGSSRKMKTQKKKEEEDKDEDEVEKLLRATEDDILLNLTVDSHMSRGSSSQVLDPDLDRRFRALRSNSKQSPLNPKSNQNLPSTATSKSADRSDLKPNQAVGDGDDDLFARFAALKSSLPAYSSSSSSSSSATASNNNQLLAKSEEEDEEEGDEVDKVIRWAMDAARLDPSSPSSDVDADDDDISDSSADESDDDDDKDDDRKNKKGKRK